MSEALLGFASAFWLGILTSISPCPLATNIAAVSFLSKKITHPKTVFFLGLFYVIGRMLTYVVLSFLIVYSLLNIPLIANFLQKYMHKALGPILIIVGLFLLDIFKFNIPLFKISEDKQNTLAQSGIKGSFLLGIIFALAFCPSSAALFFGSLIPLSLAHKFGKVFPFVYGIATGLPVLVFALFISLGIKSISRWFNRVVSFEAYARKITAIIFILAGCYYVWVYLRY